MEKKPGRHISPNKQLIKPKVIPQLNDHSYKISSIRGTIKNSLSTKVNSKFQFKDKYSLGCEFKSVGGAEVKKLIRPNKHTVNRVRGNARSENISANIQKNSLCRIKPKEEYMYNKIEKNFKAGLAKAALQKQRYELSLRKNRNIPINRQELNSHSKNYLRYRKELEDARKFKRLHRKHEDSINKLEQKRFQTNVSLSIRRKDESVMKNLKKKTEERKKVRTKVVMYSNLVKSVCPVIPSERKSIELSTMVAKLKHPVRQQRNVKSDYEVSKTIPRSKNTILRSRQSKLDKKRELNPIQIGNVKCNPETNNRKHSMNIRTRLENKRKLPSYNWKKEIMSSNMSKREKINEIIKRGKIIESQAAMKEERMLAGGLEGDLSLGEYGSNILLSSIKAKLDILDQYH